MMTLALGKIVGVRCQPINEKTKKMFTRAYPESEDFDAFPPIFSNFLKAFGSKSTTNQICSSENTAMTQYD